jgi:hypothetical protein
MKILVKGANFQIKNIWKCSGSFKSNTSGSINLFPNPSKEGIKTGDKFSITISNWKEVGTGGASVSVNSKIATSSLITDKKFNNDSGEMFVSYGNCVAKTIIATVDSVVETDFKEKYSDMNLFVAITNSGSTEISFDYEIVKI